MSDRSNDRLAQFVAALRKLDAGDRARLKRNAGRPLSEAQDATALFYRILPGSVPQSQEEVYFLIATLFPLADEGGEGNLGATLRKTQSEKNRKGLDRRLEVLLDADLDQLSFRLRQTVHFVQSNRVRVNWVGLLKDLLSWNHPDRFVQQSWARSYYSIATETTPTR